MEGYGERIKELREILKLSQQELADILQIHKQMVSDVERGKQQRFSIKSEALLIEKLHVNPLWLLTGKGEPLQTPNESVEEEMAIIKKYFQKIPANKRLEALTQMLVVLKEQSG
jgi:transcriptional regulator with XRE-family HTH domain